MERPSTWPYKGAQTTVEKTDPLPKAKTPKVERSEIKTKRLPVELKSEEVMARAKEMSQLVAEKRSASDRLEAFQESAKATKHELEGEIQEFDAKIAYLATVVRNGREDREVEVYDEFDFKEGTVFTKRADNDEVVASRGMTEAERQRSLFTGKNGKGEASTPGANAGA